MAGNIKGITIEIAGDTTGLQNALKDVNKRSSDLQKELKEVDRLLKFNPGNTELLAQKQQLLTERIAATTDKLDQLKAAQSQVEAQFQSGQIGAEQYRAFQREIATTEGSLNGLKNQLQNMTNEQRQAAKSTRELEALFDATGTTVDQFSDVLGKRLTDSIRTGAATSSMLEEAISRIGQEALGSDVDLEKLRKTLGNIHTGANLYVIRQDLKKISNEANETGEAFNHLSTDVQQSLTSIGQQSQRLQGELKEIERLLKFDPNNTELLRQKQELLSQSIRNTSDELEQLRSVQSSVEAQFQSGKIGTDQYRAFQREIVSTEGSLNGLRSQLQNMENEQQQVASSTRQLETLFQATGTSVDQFANALGSNLTSAIRQGTANSDQLQRAIDLVGREALGTGADLDKMRQALKQADSGGSLQAVRKDLSQVAKEADEAGKSVNGFGDKLKDVAAGLAAGGGIAAAVKTALDTSSLNTKIEISMDVPESSRKSVREAINTVTAYGTDAEEALEGVRRQWALNKDASDASNTAVVKMAGTIANAYAGIDFTELIQEANEIGAALGITNEEALGLVNSLLKTGFPPEQLDIISEYGEQLKIAGFSATEVQNILSAAVDTKSWNIDNLLDGLKEGKIGLSEFGLEIPKAMGELLSKTDISAKQMQTWGAAVAKGGEGGKQAMVEVAKALAGVEDATLRNELGVQIFGTKFEDQGMKIVDTMINAEKGTADLKQGIDGVNESTEKLNNDPTVAMRQAFADLKVALEPVLTVIADVIAKIAEWVQNNPALAATIAAIVSGIGILMGVLMVLSPIISTITALAPILGSAIGAISLPVLAVIAAIGLLIAAGVAIYKNWDEVSAAAVRIWGSIKDFLAATWEGIKSLASTVWDGIKLYFTTVLGIYKTIFTTAWEGIKSLLSTVWNGIKSLATTVWDGIKAYFTTVLNAYKTVFTTVWEGIKTTLSTIWNGLKSLSESVWNGIKSTITSVVNGIKTTVTTVWNGIKSVTSTVFEGIKSVVTTSWNAVKSVTSSVLNGIKGVVSDIFNGFKSVVSTAMSNVKGAIETGWNAAKSFLDGVNLLSVGKNIIQGLIDGISSKAKAVYDKISEIANNIKDKFTGLFDIHSPSRVFRGYGINLNEGLIQGIQSSSAKLNDVMNQVYGSMASSTGRMLQSNGNGMTNSSSTYDNSKVINNTININSGSRAEDIARANERVLRRLAFQFK